MITYTCHSIVDQRLRRRMQRVRKFAEKRHFRIPTLSRSHHRRTALSLRFTHGCELVSSFSRFHPSCSIASPYFPLSSRFLYGSINHLVSSECNDVRRSKMQFHWMRRVKLKHHERTVYLNLKNGTICQTLLDLINRD